MNIQTILRDFGLNEKEILVYTTLISLGAAPVRILAQKAKVNRGTAYDILKSLQKQGLVSFYHTQSHQYFTAEDPEKLVSALEKKQNEIEIIKTHISEHMPELKLAFEKRGGRPLMKLYEGTQGLKAILEDVLVSVAVQKEKAYYVYSSASVRKNVYQAMPDFSQKRIKKKITVKTIALGDGGQLMGMDERKWMNVPKSEPKATYEILYAGKIAHISLDDSENPVGVVIENEEIFETQKMIFEFNWSKL